MRITKLWNRETSYDLKKYNKHETQHLGSVHRPIYFRAESIDSGDLSQSAVFNNLSAFLNKKLNIKNILKTWFIIYYFSDCF